MKEKQLMNAEQIKETIDELSKKICNNIKDIEKFAIIGVHTRGVVVAQRIRKNIEEITGKRVQHGVLDVTFHRDDLATRGILPEIKETRFEFDITNMVILLVDDVIFTGRTTKAGLETLMSYGRPKAIKYFAFVDRGNRELPIQPDYCGLKIETSVSDNVNVMFTEIDDVNEDKIVLSYE